jgi:hypothetical protein
LLSSTLLVAQQPPPPLPPQVGNAVLLATHSVQVDRDVVVTRGDLVVNDAGGTLEIDQNVTTPRGFAVKGDRVGIDGNAYVGGDAYYNVLRNDGTIGGMQVRPLALPVIGTLPTLDNHPAGTENVSVANGATQILGRGDYAALVVGKDATLRLGGGPYAFSSITTERGGSIIFDGPGELHVNGPIVLGQGSTIGAGPGLFTKHKMIFAHADVSIGKESSISATIFAPNGTIDTGESLTLLGSFVARDIHVGRSSTLTLRSGFRNLPPVADSQTISLSTDDPVVITLTGSDPDLDPLRFTIQVPPANGTLGPVLPSGPTSAVVVYTPRAARVNDAFVFRVTDPENFFADGVVTVNEGVALPGPPTTVIAQRAVYEIPPNRPALLTLNAIAPPGVALTISIVPGSGPVYGTLGPIQQPSQTPPRPASVPYIPAPNFVGQDSFQFQACGVIGGEEVCSVATVEVAVIGPDDAGELAPDRTAEATTGVPSPITLAAGPAPATYRIISLPQNGTLTDTNGVTITQVPYTLPSGIVTYRSANGFTGTNTFAYEVTSGGPQPQTDRGTVTVTVSPAPAPDPSGTKLAPDITVSAVSGAAATFLLPTSAGSYRVLSLPANGTLTDVNGNAIASTPYPLPSPALTYLSSAGFTGTVSFTYAVTSGAQSDTGVVTIIVTAGSDNGR